MTYQELPLSTKIKIKMICNRNNITKPSDIETAYNNYVEGRDIFEGLSEDYQRVSAFDNYLANGGHIYSGEDEDTQQMQKAEPNIFQRPDGSYFYQVPGGEEIDVTPINTLSEDNSRWTYTDASGRVYNPAQPLQNNYSLTEAENANAVERAINNYTRELAWREANDPASIALQGKYVLPAIGMSSLAASPATLPYLNTALASGFGAHGIQDLANGNADWQTALEVAPLASLAKPMAKAAAPALEWAANGLERNVGLGRNAAGDWNGWIRVGNTEFRPSRTSANMGLKVDTRPAIIEGFEGVTVPEGFTPVRVINQNMRNGSRTVHLVKDNSTGKFKILEDMNFKSELDWSPKSWFEEAAGRKYKDGSKNQYNDADIKALESHIPEYEEIERTAKLNGTWLKMPDGSTWEGDPRSWVQYMSKAAQEAAKGQKKEIFWTGIHAKEVDPNFMERIWGLPAENQSIVAPAKAATYAPDDSKVMPMLTVKYEDPEAISVIDAEGYDWHAIPHNKEFKKTDDVVDAVFSRKGKKTVKINNVLDTGDYNVPSSSKYYYEGIGNNKRIQQNNIILNNGTFRKALIGNNGNFKHPTHIYRGLIPIGLGYSAYNILNE